MNAAPRIAILDDDAEFLRAVTELYPNVVCYQDPGVRTRFVYDAPKYDIVLVDYELVLSTGTEVIRTIAKLHSQHIPTMLITDVSGDELRARAFDAVSQMISKDEIFEGHLLALIRDLDLFVATGTQARRRAELKACVATHIDSAIVDYNMEHIRCG